MDGGLLTLKLLAGKEETVVEVRRMRGDERLQDAWRRGQRLLTQMLGTRGNLTPGQQPTAVRLECFLEASLRRSGIDGGREEADADGEGAVALEGDAGGMQQKVAGQLRHDSDAVAAFAIGGDGSAMCKAAQRCEGMSQHFVRGLIGNTRNKAHATGVMVKARIKQRCRWQGGLRQARVRMRIGTRSRAWSRYVGTRGRRSGSRRVPVVRHS